MNPLLDVAGVQYMAWRATAQAIAGTGYLGSTGSVGTHPYRPYQWHDSNTTSPILFYMTSAYSAYFFDAVLKAEHNNQRRITEHPVQTGANITDHSYQLAARLSLEIGVSDVMDCYDAEYDWNAIAFYNDGSPIRSINAFQGLLALQKSGEALSVTTRLFTYDNMIIENIIVPEDYKTLYSLRATIFFQQIIVAEASKTKVSLHPSITDEEKKGKLNLPATTTPVRDSALYKALFQKNYFSIEGGN